MCRRKLLVELVSRGVSVAEAARQAGLSRGKAYKWLGRFESGGLGGLEDQSRVRKTSSRFDGELAEAFLQLRRDHPTWGPRKLVAWFERHSDEEELPAASTVGELLKRSNLIKPRVRFSYHQPFRFVGPVPSEPNHRWTGDFKGHFRLGNGALCHPLTLRDAASRKLFAITALSSTQWDPVQRELERCFREYGLPLEFQTDLGSPFGSRGIARLSKLSTWLLKLDVLPLFGRPAKPQDNGGHERMHKDLKAETTRPPAWSVAGQQRKFDRFRRVFNEERPHEALDGDLPDDRWKPSPRRFPKRIDPPEYPTWWEVRRVNTAAGTISWNDHTLKIGAAFRGEDLGFEPIDDRVHRVHFYRYAIGILDARGPKPELMSQLKRSAA